MRASIQSVPDKLPVYEVHRGIYWAAWKIFKGGGAKKETCRFFAMARDYTNGWIWVEAPYYRFLEKLRILVLRSGHFSNIEEQYVLRREIEGLNVFH